MPLPKIEHPVYQVYLRSLNRKVKFRPFLVRDEKLLLIAKESDDPEEIIASVKQILQNCLVDEINVDELPMFDVEMLFIHTRAKSLGEKVALQFKCTHTQADGNECGEVNDYTLDLDKVTYVEEEPMAPEIMLSDKIGIKFYYPKLTTVIDFSDNEYERSIRQLVNHIEYVFDEDSMYYPKDLSDDDILELLSSLTLEQLHQIEKFFKNIPRVTLEDTVKCSKCGTNHKIKSEDLLDFFT